MQPGRLSLCLLVVRRVDDDPALGRTVDRQRTDVIRSSPTSACRKTFTRRPGRATSPLSHSRANSGPAADSPRAPYGWPWAGVLPPDPTERSERRRGLDLPGLVLLGAAVSLFTVPLVLGQEQDWPLWSWLSLTGSAVVFALFCGYESRLARRGGTPLIAPRVLRHPGMSLAVLRILAVMAVNGGFLFALTLHVQGGLGFSALRVGLTFAPTALVFGLVGLTWRRWPASWQRRPAPAGFWLTALSVAGVGLVLDGGGDGGALVYVAYAGVGAGLALGFSPTLTGALAGVRPEDTADASGLLATVTQLGQLTGVAVFGTLFLNRVESLGALKAYTSAEALSVCMFALAGTAAVAAVSGLVLRRR